MRLFLPDLGEAFVEAAERSPEGRQIYPGPVEQILQARRRIALLVDERDQGPADPLPIEVRSADGGGRLGFVRNAAF
jgi:hypothetical protein